MLEATLEVATVTGADETAVEDDDVGRMTSPVELALELVLETLEAVLLDDDEVEVRAGVEDDGVDEDETAVELEELAGVVVPQAGKKTQVQPPVQFSPSSSQIGTVQPRPQVGSS